MPLHVVAFICSGVLLVPLGFIQVIMRQQAHDARYGVGSPEISPWDVRYLNGIHGIWTAHKKAYEHSALRSLFVALSGVWLVAVLVGAFALLFKR